MGVSARVILDSVSREGIRLTTVQCRYPKFIHGELMTHRVFSRNASSSRAIPVARLIQDVIDDPALPEKWFKNQKGMQGTVEIVGAERDELVEQYLMARNQAVRTARNLDAMGAHKQHVNRVIEPFCHINTLITSTDWANFNALRDHPKADPTIAALSVAIQRAMASSVPHLLDKEWHLPYVGHVQDPSDNMKRISVASCASVSYLTVDEKEMTQDRADRIYEQLLGEVPIHASPAEHLAYQDRRFLWVWRNRKLHGNFRGWVQYRKTLPGECVKEP